MSIVSNKICINTLLMRGKFFLYSQVTSFKYRSNKCISSELVCDGEADCPESDDESECIGLIAPTKKKHIKYVAINIINILEAIHYTSLPDLRGPLV